MNYSKYKDIRPRNDKNKAHGYWELYYYTGDIFYKGLFVNGKEVGYYESTKQHKLYLTFAI